MQSESGIKRRCPVCGSYLKIIHPNFKDQGKVWEVCECPNDGSEVWIVPFSKIKKQ